MTLAFPERTDDRPAACEFITGSTCECECERNYYITSQHLTHIRNYVQGVTMMTKEEKKEWPCLRMTG